MFYMHVSSNGAGNAINQNKHKFSMTFPCLHGHHQAFNFCQFIFTILKFNMFETYIYTISEEIS